MKNSIQVNKFKVAPTVKLQRKIVKEALSQTVANEVEVKNQHRFLVLGSKGMLGGQFLKIFGSAAVGWDKEECDVLNEADLTEKIERLAPSAVINCVAFNDVDGAEDKPDLAFKLNVEAVGNLARLCKSIQIPLVHFSTNYVFNGNKGEFDENVEPNPVSLYGKTKHQGEIELVKNTDQYYLIRTSVLFGPEGESGLSKKSFVELMLNLATKNNPIKAVNDEVNSLTYVLDLARKVEVLLKEKAPFGIYHIVNSGQASWYDFAKEIFEIKKINTKLIPVPASEFVRKAQRPSKSVLLNTKLSALRSWQEALKEFLSVRSN